VVARVATGAGFGPPDLEREIGAFVASLPACPTSLGIAFPGLVGADGAITACDVLPRFVGWRPSPAITGPWRFAMINDGEAALVAEARDAGPDASVAVIVVGTGIGAAFQVDGRVLKGSRGWAGELGSIPIATGGVRTLDQLASGQAIVEKAGCDGAEVERRAAAGDPRILGIVREAGSALGLGIATVLDLLNPAVLGLGGGVLRLAGYLEAARETARAHTLPALWDACVVRPLRDGEYAAATGAAIAAT
jgi:predicted NBD/HSP70 family sugar kinase